MISVSQQRCLNHLSREAVARCPTCQQFFCRECITEHDDRVICAGCLRSVSEAAKARRVNWQPLRTFATAAGAFLTVWLCFYFAGQILLKIPSTFHEGNLWKIPTEYEDQADR